MLRIGVTGGIGSGKSTAARVLVEQGAALIDADAISRRLTEPGGAAMAPIAAQFGWRFITPKGAMDRDAMRALVFEKPSARQHLEAIIHPLVRQESAAQENAARLRGCKVVVFDIPLLVESGRWRSSLDQVLVIDCTETTQISRVLKREGERPGGGHLWTQEMVHRIIAGQASRKDRLKAADASIFNDGLSLQALDAMLRLFGKRFGL